MIAINNRKLIIILIALTAWFALALQLFILLNNTPGNGMTPLQAIGRFLIFFTVLSNLLVAISLTAIAIKPASEKGRFFTKPSVTTAIALYIFIVGLVYNIILRSLWQPVGLQRVADELLHVAVPVLFTLYWLLLAAKSPLQWKHAFQWLVFPAAYLAYALIRGAIEDFYPYPFIDVNKHGYGTVLVNSAIFLVVFVVAGLAFIAIGKKIGQQAKIR